MPNPNNNFIMQMRPFFGEEESSALSDYLKEDVFLTEFRKTSQFESMLCDYTGAKHCIVVSNGTISLTIAALSLGIGHGDEVIVPNYTMIATPNSIKLLGADPVFVDVESSTLCLDINSVENVITPRTKALVLVSANGRYPSYDIGDLISLCSKYGISIIEDAAQSLGSCYPSGIHMGRSGLVGSFSFSAPKIISTGQGGALVTDSDDIAIKIKRLKDFGRTSGGNDLHEVFGINAKFTDLQAVVGIEQLKKISERVCRKREIWNLYKFYLSDLDQQITLFDHDLSCTTPWFIDCLAVNRDSLIDYLKLCNIGTRKMYPPINSQLIYQSDNVFPVSSMVGRCGLWLPSYVQLTDEEIYYVCSCIQAFYNAQN